MSKINTNISLDSTLKKEAVELFKSFGLDLSTAISLFLSQAVREQRIPFEIRKYVPNSETISAIKETIDMEEHPDDYKAFSSIDELMGDVTCPPGL